MMNHTSWPLQQFTGLQFWMYSLLCWEVRKGTAGQLVLLLYCCSGWQDLTACQAQSTACLTATLTRRLHFDAQQAFFGVKGVMLFLWQYCIWCASYTIIMWKDAWQLKHGAFYAGLVDGAC